MNTAATNPAITLHLRIAAAVALFSLAGSSLVPLLHAVPQQVGAIGVVPFINPAGMRLEDFANRKAMWQDAAALKGEWEMWSDTKIDDSTIELLRLKNSATVYGLEAVQVLLQRRDSRPLQFDVKFSTAEEAAVGKTRDQLISNINAWTGSTLELKNSVGSIEHENIAIKVDATRKNEVRVTLKPLAAS